MGCSRASAATRATGRATSGCAGTTVCGPRSAPTRRSGPTPSGCAAQFVFGNQSKLTVGSGVDSYYEYLLKAWLQEGGSGRPPRTWSDAVDSVDANLINVRGPTTFMADIEKNKTLGNRATHLACFWPGLRALEAIVDPPNGKLALAEQLLDACVAAYDATPTNLAPEAWHVNDDGSVKLGANLRHLLRPETIESVAAQYGVSAADATGGARSDAAARRGAPREATRALKTTRARSAMRARDAMPAPGDARAATHDDTVIVVVDARWLWPRG